MADRSKTIAIIGQGYVGLPLAMAAVQAGWSVIGVENSLSRYTTISVGMSPVEDVPAEQVQGALAAGVYQVTRDPADVNKASVVIVCVPTPLDYKREPDLSVLERAITDIAPHLADNTLVINESTSYPGTLRDFIGPLIIKYKDTTDLVIHLAVAPERVNPGDQVWGQKNTPRLIGGVDEISTNRAIDFYGTICDRLVVVTKPEIAEAAKLLENTYRLVNIALVNQLAQICANENLNVHEVIEAASTKPYGFQRFTPSVGVGGHCIPVDPMYLSWWAEKNGTSASLISRADEINRGMPLYVSQRVIDLLPENSRKRVLILGVAYKSGVKDVRETPATALRDDLIDRGCEVGWIDPLVDEWEGTSAVGISWHCDVAVVAVAQPGLPVEAIAAKDIPILDCTGAYRKLPGVVRL
ncbi:MAG: nucleotide sugar dehydrogenase [Actinomycetota bacterium]